MCDVKKMFLFVLKRDKICFGGILDNFCYSVQSVVGWNLGGAFLVVIFPMKSGAFWEALFMLGGSPGGTLGGTFHAAECLPINAGLELNLSLAGILYY